MTVIGIVLLAAAAALGILIYRYVRRTAAAYGLDTDRFRVKLVLLAATVGIVLLTADFTSAPSAVCWHFLTAALLTELADRIVRKCSGERYETDCRVWHRLVARGLIPLALTAVILTWGMINMYHVVETRYSLTTEKEIRDEGWRVILIADVHYGVLPGRQALIGKCAEISEKHPDVVILCGDIVDNETAPEEVEEAFAAFGSIRAKHGVYYVYGNHDRSTERLPAGFSDEFLKNAIESSGIRILQDETLALEGGMTLIGREDYYAPRNGRERKPLSELLRGTDRNSFLMVLDHQPREYAENVEQQTDLILSGHTHAGQLFPAGIVEEIIGFCDGVYGLYEPGGSTRAIVTSGFAGWTYPFRTERVSEYVTVDISRE